MTNILQGFVSISSAGMILNQCWTRTYSSPHTR